MMMREQKQREDVDTWFSWEHETIYMIYYRRKETRKSMMERPQRVQMNLNRKEYGAQWAQISLLATPLFTSDLGQPHCS